MKKKKTHTHTHTHTHSKTNRKRKGETNDMLSNEINGILILLYVITNVL